MRRSSIQKDRLTLPSPPYWQSPAKPLRQNPWRALFYFTTKQHLPVLTLSIIVAIVGGFVVPAQAILLGKIFQSFAGFAAGKDTSSKFSHDISNYCVYLTALGGGSWILEFAFLFAWMLFGDIQGKSARDHVFSGLLAKDTAWFDMQEQGVAAMVPRLQMYFLEHQIAVSQPLGYTVQCLATTVACVGLALYYSWNLTLVILATVPPVAFAVTYFARRVEPNLAKQHEKLAEAAKHTTSAFNNIEMVKCYNGQDSEIWSYSGIAKQAAKFYIRQVSWNAVQQGLIHLCSMGMFVQGFWYGSSLVNDGQKPGDILTTFWAAMMATSSFMQILPQIIVLQKGKAAASRLRVLIDRSSRQSHGDEPSGVRPSQCCGEICMDNVTFSYPTTPDVKALVGAQLSFNAMKMTFIIGNSGSGKSTIGQLLLRFYSPTSGRILLDGRDLDDLDVQWLRQNIMLVEQTSVLFEESFSRNIALGACDPDEASPNDIREAARFALIDNFISLLPDQYQTTVGSKGGAMSGGQRQRMALARSRIRNSPILILDECTSALDVVSRTAMMRNIREWRAGRTTIIITHDMSQVETDDFVYILERGCLVEQGLRRELESTNHSRFSSFVSNTDNPARPARTSGGSLDSVVSDLPMRMPDFEKSTPTPKERTGKRRSLRPLSNLAFFDKASAAPQGAGAAGRNSVILPPVAAPFWQVSPRTGQIASGWSPTKRCSFEIVGSASPSPQYVVETLFASQTFNEKDPLIPEKVGSTERPANSGELESPATAEDNDLQAETVSTILKTVWPNLDPFTRMILTMGVICAFAHAAATPVFAYVFSQLLATFYQPGKQTQEALKYSMAVLGIAIFDAICATLLVALLEYCGMSWINRLRTKAIRRILDQPREFFDDARNSVSRLAETLDHHAEEMRNIVGRFVGFLFIAALMMCVAIIWSLVSCWKLTLVGLAAGPILYILTTTFEKVANTCEQRCIASSEAAGAVLMEAFTNIKTMRILTLEKTFTVRYRQATTKTLKAGLRRALFAGFFFGLSESAMIFVTALLFYYGAKLVVSREFTVSDILQTFNLLFMSMSTVNSLIGYIPQLGSSRGSGTRLLRLVNLPEDSHELKGTTRISGIGSIVFNRLSFAYPSRPSALSLRNISMSIPVGSTVAIVGGSGSGKSTIASLLLCLYSTGTADDAASTLSDRHPHSHPHQTNSLTLTGRDIHRIHVPTLRSLIALVPQSPVLFPATVAANISYGLASASPLAGSANVRAAAEAAGIHDFITSLPIGYNTLIGEGGMGLSGGQAQRIVIARALIRRPRVLILDEATSALDAESAEVIRSTVRRLGQRGWQTEDMNTAAASGHEDGGLVPGKTDARGEDASAARMPKRQIWQGESRKQRARMASQASNVAGSFSAVGGRRVGSVKGRPHQSHGQGYGHGQALTIIIITHAREMMAIADRIFMMADGELVEEGGFEELAARGGRFTRLLAGERERENVM